MTPAMSRPVRTLLFSTLYPSSARPGHGLFVETRLRELLRTGQVETKVLAPVPWFASTHARFGEYARVAATPTRETRNGIEVLHPRYLTIPRIGMSVAPLLLAAGSMGTLRRLLAQGFDFDVIDAHYFYPDGVAAAMLGRIFGKPVTITARGSDLNLIPNYRLARRMIQWAAHRADASIGVSNALVDVLRGWHVDSQRLHVFRNGVDLRRFSPLPRDPMRRELGFDGSPLLLSVGNLVELKGHHLTIDALPSIAQRHPQVQLAIVGSGEERARLEQRARDRGVLPRVRFAGTVANEQLARWYSAADALVLASSREGWANVLLESMACGTPVVATRVGGTAEVVTNAVGVLVDERSAEAIAAAVCGLLDAPPSRVAVRAYAEDFGWEQTSHLQLQLFRRLAGAPEDSERSRHPQAAATPTLAREPQSDGPSDRLSRE
jgi:teichuronic acid biosynthesis glycosyltransferase TuaC